MDSWDVPFESAWMIGMRSKRVRDWLFDVTSLPLATCLATCTEKPALSGFSITPASTCAVDYPTPEIGQVLCVAYQSADHILCTSFVLDNKNTLLPAAHVLAKNPCFKDNRIATHRVVLIRHPTIPALVVRIDFAWLLSGVLAASVFIQPFACNISSPALVHIHARLFSPKEAADLRQAAQFPTPAFLNGTTQLLNPRNGYVALDLHDTRHVSACVFCISRSLSKCECPVLFRRRHQPPRPPHPHMNSRESNVVSWNRFEKSIKESITTGALTVNWRIIKPQQSGPPVKRVLVSRLVSYGFFHTTDGVSTNRLIQRLFNDVGLTLGKPQLSLSESSALASDNDKANTKQTASSADENVIDITQRSSYSVNAAILGTDVLETSVCTKPVVQTTSQHFLQPVPSIRKRPRAPNPLIGRPFVATRPSSHAATLSQPSTIAFSTPHIESKSAKTREKSPSASKSASDTTTPTNEQATGVTNAISTLDRLTNLEFAVQSLSAAVQLKGAQEALATNIEKSTVDPSIAKAEEGGGPSNSTANEPDERVAANLWRCRECGKLIRGKRGNLNRHRANRHDKLRPFQCSYVSCAKQFQTRLNLVRHERTVHEGRPQQCEKCPRAFKTEHELATHVNIAHNADGPTMACEICGCCFGRRSTLNRHTSKVHGTKKSAGGNRTASSAR